MILRPRIAFPLVAFAMVSAFTAPPLRAAEPATASPLQGINDGLVAVFEKVAPAVVVIEVEKKADPDAAESAPSPFDFFFREPPGSRPPGDRRFRMPAPAPQSEGSGFIVRADGFIYTNNHVVDGAEKITVKLRDGRKFPAKLVGADERTDIAVIRIDSKDLPVAELGDSDAARVGQIVCAIGTPFNLDYTFTLGVISAKGRSNLQPDITYEEYIQTDASINPGNSGGPLFDIHGRVLGMNTLINGINRGLGFAIPSTMLREVGEALIRDGKIVRPWLGVRIQSLSESADLREHFAGVKAGVVVRTIEAGTPAFKSALRPADVITKVDGVPVTSARDLQKEVLRKKVGQKLELEIWRAGESKTIPVVTGQMPDDLSTLAARSGERSQPPAGDEEKEDALSAWGLQVQDLTRELMQSLEISAEGGALVSDVAAESPAAVAGLQVQDVITEVNGKPVADAAALRKAIAAADPAKGILLLVDRQGEKTYAVLKRAK